MSWYASIQEANKALKRKTKEYKEEFIVVKDTLVSRCYTVVKKEKQDQPPAARPTRARDRSKSQVGV